MKRFMILALLAVLVPGLLLAQEERRGGERGGDDHGEARPARPAARPKVRNNVRPRQKAVRNVRPANVRANNVNARVRVAPQFRSMGVRTYPKPFARNKILVVGRERSSIAFPERGPAGVSLHANVIARNNFSSNVIVRNHMAVVMNPTFRAQINLYNNNERVVGNYYWHTGNGFNFCHYYDRWGYHWYGWYLGNSYFWTRWYSNHYWWYDPTYYRWCYWHDGGWWWQDPDTTTLYIYNNGNYVNSNASSSQPAPAPQPSGNASKTFMSPDGNRMVKLMGNDAFLYDASGNNAFKAVYMASNVADVKFSNTSNGNPLQVMLILKDGTFESFDDQGNALNGANNGGGFSDSSQSAGNPAASGAMAQPPSGGNPPSAPGN